MPIKYLTPSKTTYSFGGGSNDVQVANPNDTTSYTVNLGGGDDTATLGAGNDLIIGGSGSNVISGGLGNDTIYGGDTSPTTSRTAETNTLYGDSANTETSAGIAFGNDTIYGASGSSNYTNNMYGDAAAIAGASTGGNDQLVGGDYAVNNMYGDAGSLTNGGGGGNDTITGGNNAQNYIYGDAGTMIGDAVSGNDTLIGGNGGGNTIYGDASGYTATSGTHVMGSDNITGGSGAGTTNILYGDAGTISATGTATITAGNDVITAGNYAVNTMYGDAQFQSGNVICGNDTLISGTGNDVMWGDVSQALDGGTIVGGADTFVFLANSGQDIIMDFGVGADTIDLTALAAAGTDGNINGIHSATDLTFSQLTNSAGATSGVLIGLGGGNTITAMGTITAANMQANPTAYFKFA